MKHIGIIAELNPFHNGHAYLIQQAKQMHPDKQIVIIMSGDYVQRGEPAIFNKYIRTKCALAAGADIVLELPSLFASASAEHFASAAVLALAATNMIDTLCFGIETEDFKALQTIASFLVAEPDSYRNTLRQKQANGLSFAKARAAALSEHFKDSRYQDILTQPNNILAIEYLKAMEKHHLAIHPEAILRQGAGYHDSTLSTTYCSATALRTAMIQGLTKPYDSLRPYMPEEVYSILVSEPDALPLFWNDFMPFLQYALSAHTQSFDQYCDISTDFHNTLSSCTLIPDDFAQLTQKLSGKHLSQSRIRRCLLNILLQQTQEQMDSAKSCNYISYVRLLGFREHAAPILKDIKNNGSIPVINKVADAGRLLSPDTHSLFESDIHKSHLYHQTFYNRYHIALATEYEHSVIIYK